MKETGKQSLLRLLFVCYCLLMLWLLFVQGRGTAVEDYWSQMEQNVNLTPLKTVRLYLYVFQDPELAHLIPHAIVNLAGNVVMFIPLGFFLGAVFPKLRRLWKVLLLTAAVICVIEILQLLTLAGSCDVDDLLLNVVGAAIGYGIYKIFKK